MPVVVLRQRASTSADSARSADSDATQNSMLASTAEQQVGGVYSTLSTQNQNPTLASSTAIGEAASLALASASVASERGVLFTTSTKVELVTTTVFNKITLLRPTTVSSLQSTSRQGRAPSRSADHLSLAATFISSLSKTIVRYTPIATLTQAFTATVDASSAPPGATQAALTGNGSQAVYAGGFATFFFQVCHQASL